MPSIGRTHVEPIPSVGVGIEVLVGIRVCVKGTLVKVGGLGVAFLVVRNVAVATGRFLIR